MASVSGCMFFGWKNVRKFSCWKLSSKNAKLGAEKTFWENIGAKSKFLSRHNFICGKFATVCQNLSEIGSVCQKMATARVTLAKVVWLSGSCVHVTGIFRRCTQQRDCSDSDDCQVAWRKTTWLWNFKVDVINTSRQRLVVQQTCSWMLL